jgi:hypothetical protein
MTEYYDEQKHTLRNHLQQLESQLADVLGDLDAAVEAHPEHQIEALGARLRYLEMRRSAEARLLWQTGVAEGQMATLRDIANSLGKTVDRLLEPPADHTVIKARGLGMQIHASGRAGDPVFEGAAREVAKLSAKLTDLREEVIRHEMTLDFHERGGDGGEPQG